MTEIISDTLSDLLFNALGCSRMLLDCPRMLVECLRLLLVILLANAHSAVFCIKISALIHKAEISQPELRLNARSVWRPVTWSLAES